MEKRYKTRIQMVTGLVKRCFEEAWNEQNGLNRGHLVLAPIIPFIIGSYALAKSFNPGIRDKETREYIVKDY